MIKLPKYLLITKCVYDSFDKDGDRESDNLILKKDFQL